jgi:hypothetical protein
VRFRKALRDALMCLLLGLSASPRVSNNPSQSMIFRKNKKIHLQQLPNSSPNLLAFGEKTPLARKDSRTPGHAYLLSCAYQSVNLKVWGRIKSRKWFLMHMYKKK